MIHIIRFKCEDNSILSRKARVLVEELGWSIGSHPDPDAELNYSLPYLDGRNTLGDLRFAAYFTHREDCLPAKVEIWKDRARKAALRITSAQQYFEDLSQYGPTAKITPPLDRKKFSPPRTLRLTEGNKIGVAGFVYKGGRKGEDLLQEAVKRIGDRYEFKAIGKGWPIPTIALPYDRLHEFYQSIDIFLCTSLIEGVPYPPLEALACGKKVVIPIGVGMMDELPDIPGIRRYKAGDIDDMIRAIESAREDSADSADLRETTSPFTVENWAQGHADAFGELEAMAFKTARNKKKMRSDRGIYVVAFGNEARFCARRLVKSVRQYMPDTPVAVASERPLPEADHHIKFEDAIGPGARKIKLSAYELTPEEWKQVIYLDADTELTESIEHLYFCLESGWEMVFTKDINSRDVVPFLKRRKGAEDYNETLALVGSEEEIALAGGVWAFRRSPGAKRFLHAWKKEWGDGKYRDQPSMLRAYYKAKVRAIVIGNEWNSFTMNRHENRYEIIRHYSGGTARSRPVVLEQAASSQVVVKNVSQNPLERAGLLFMPNSEVIVNCAISGFKEIKACESLQILRTAE